MSNIKEPTKKPKNSLPIELRKELNSLPILLKEKKLEKEIIYKDILKTKERINAIKKELNKITVNIISLEKEYTSLLQKTDKVKSNQRITLNLINNEILNNNNIFFKPNQVDEINELFSVLFNFENDYKEEISILLLNNNIEFNKLLIGGYIYLKMLQNDIPHKYQEIKKRLLELVNKAKEKNKEHIYELIFCYLENILTILDNKDKNIAFNKRHEEMVKSKNEIFLKLKLIEEQKNEKEEKFNLISNYIKEIHILIEKNNLLLNFPKNSHNNNNSKNNEINTSKNKIINLTQNSLNISCPKNTINNDFRKTDEKVNIINIDLTSTSLHEKNYINKTSKKESESLDHHPQKNKKFFLPKYKNISELEKDINEQYLQIKSSHLFKTKKKIIKKKVINNTNNNANNPNPKKQMKITTNKSKEKKIEKINKNNTTMTYNTNSNEVINNVNNIISGKDMNKSFDSTLNKKIDENDKIKLIENAKIIQLRNISNSTDKKHNKLIIEEKKNNIDEDFAQKKNQSSKDNNAIKNSNNNKYISIKHNKTNLKKKNSLNKIKINQSKKKLNINISNNNTNNNNLIRKNSPENKNIPFLYNIINNNNKKNILNKSKNNNINNFITEQNGKSVRNNSPNNNIFLNNNNNKSIDNNKNCHIIPFKKYKINYIKDKKIENKSNKKGIRIYTNNYPSDKIRANYIQKNYIYNSQIIKHLPKDDLNSNKNSLIKV